MFIVYFGMFCLQPTIDSIVSHMVKYFRDIPRTCPFTLTNVTATLPIIEAFRYVYKSNPVVLAGVIDHSVWRGYQPSPTLVISHTGMSPAGY